jgi:hypothetical protein
MSRRRFRPTATSYRRSGSHKRLSGANDGYAALRTDLPPSERQEPPGSRPWREQHGRKSALTFCEALRTLRGMSLHLIDDSPLNVYPCVFGPAFDGPPAGLHWHVGHRRTGMRPGVTLL